MQTKEELVKLYSTFSDKELLDIVNEQDRYTANALSAASEEIQKRDIKEEQVQDYVEEKVIEAKITEHVASIQLTFFEKLKFFFIWLLPFIGFANRMNMAEDGLATKVKQSKIFSIVGFLSFMLTGLLAVIFGHSNFESISIWILFFVLTYMIEKKIKGSK